MSKSWTRHLVFLSGLQWNFHWQPTKLLTARNGLQFWGPHLFAQGSYYKPIEQSCDWSKPNKIRKNTDHIVCYRVTVFYTRIFRLDKITGSPDQIRNNQMIMMEPSNKRIAMIKNRKTRASQAVSRSSITHYGSMYASSSTWCLPYHHTIRPMNLSDQLNDQAK